MTEPYIASPLYEKEQIESMNIPEPLSGLAPELTEGMPEVAAKDSFRGCLTAALNQSSLF